MDHFTLSTSVKSNVLCMKFAESTGTGPKSLHFFENARDPIIRQHPHSQRSRPIFS